VSTPPLFLLDALPAGDHVVLTGDEGRHAARVRRMRTGESVRLGDGSGTVLECRITAVRQDGLLLDVLARHRLEPPDPRLVVVQALAKGDRGELAIEAMTELGVDELVPWSAQHSVAAWVGAKAERGVERWRRTVREAAKQSRRPWVPGVSGLADTAAVVARLRPACALVLHESAERPLVEATLPESGEIVLVVGPEGGISDAELERFTAAGATAVRLGEAVLRTSTAGAAALSVLSLRLGRWS
jgi:16S rRNA (uracil1498-N3)-methyltransferase